MGTARQHGKRLVAALGVGVVTTTLMSPAHADPPSNDTASRAIVVSAVPSDFELDTREATYDTVERRCVFGRSVWYRYTPATSGRVRITTIGSSYDTVLAVYTGTRSPRTRVACNDDAARLQAAVRPSLLAGQPYWIAASRCCGRPSAPGGDLDLRFSQDPATPSVEIVDLRATTGGISGRLRVTGELTCATPSVVSWSVTASQRIDTHVARGSGRRFLSFCSTEPVEQTVRIDSETGWAFATGLAALDVSAVGDDGFSRFPLHLEQNVEVTDDPLGRVAR